MNYNNSLAFLSSETIPFEEKKLNLLSGFQSFLYSKRVGKLTDWFKSAEFNWKWHLSHHDSKFNQITTHNKTVKKIQEECIHFYGIEKANSAIAQISRRDIDPMAYNTGLVSFRKWDRDSVLLAIVVNKVFMCINKNRDRVKDIVRLSTVKETRGELLSIELIPGIKFRDLKASGTILDKLDKYYEDEDFIYEFDRNIGSNEDNKRFNAFQKHKRIVRKVRVRENELEELHKRTIGVKNSYCSNVALMYRNYVDECQRDYIENSYIQYGDDVTTQKPLADVIMTPERRVAELYSCVKNMELVAEQKRYVCLFLTATCPASFHSNPKFGKNTWDGSTPREASNYLSKKLDELSKARNRYEFNDFGLWTKELHKDQCPHLHALLFVSPCKVDDLIFHINRIFRHSEKSTTIETISAEQAEGRGKKKASASTYVMKYLIKAIQDPDSESLKVKAGCMIWGIRRYGFFGVERAISVWRKFNRFVKMADWQINLELKSPIFKTLVSFRKDLKFLDFCKLVKAKLEWVKELEVVERLHEYQDVITRKTGLRIIGTDIELRTKADCVIAYKAKP
ncbi:replication endonuclease [Pseudomonas petrae]|uniref:Replication endonuclease n=1 Tax=Pseudomonas petrae TaxID=2912190 RepID=A0ABS9IEI5_9PSED|nr:replication endonuclease [Pseudomonas petrae]MCF7537082.1 replication endonuclease [Pseudomonas petrae]MCF7545674.1 replication endonuclease [Pseudomonas petrae]